MCAMYEDTTATIRKSIIIVIRNYAWSQLNSRNVYKTTSGNEDISSALCTDARYVKTTRRYQKSLQNYSYLLGLTNKIRTISKYSNTVLIHTIQRGGYDVLLHVLTEWALY